MRLYTSMIAAFKLRSRPNNNICSKFISSPVQASLLRRTIFRFGSLLLALIFPLVGLGQSQPLVLTAVTPITSSAVVSGSGLVMVKWTGGTGPFQVQCCNGFNGVWQDVAGVTSGSGQTNIMMASLSEYRVVDVSSVMAKSLDKTPPSVPTGLAATAVGSNQVTLTWGASTDSGTHASGVKGYNVYRGGVFLMQVAAPSTSATNTGLTPATTYTYAVSAVDNAYNESAKSSPVSVTTLGGTDTTPPTVSLTAPTSGSTVSNTITLTATASDNVGVTSVQFYRDGTTLVGTATVSPYYIGFDTTTLANGSHSFSAKAYDAAGNSTMSVANTVTVNNFTCTYAVSPLSDTFTAAGGGGNIAVTAGSTCPWAAASDTNWITVTSGASGNGSGTVAFSVAANTATSVRASTLSVAGQIVTVSQSAHLVPSASAGPSQSTSVGNSLTFNGSGSAFDGATITGYNWIFGDSRSASGASVSHTYTNAGTYTVTFTITDSFGASSSATTTATITNVVVAPRLSVALTNPAAGATVSNTVILAAAATNATEVIFYCDGVSVGTVTSAPFTNAWNTTTVANGPHNLYAQAYDANANSVISATNVVTVSNAATGTAGQLKWVDTMATPDGYGAEGNSVAADAAGNEIVVGDFNGGVNLGGGTLLSGQAGMFIAKYSASGGLLWGNAISAGGWKSKPNSVCVDSQNNIIVAGLFAGTVNFGGVNLTAPDPHSIGADSMFVAKYSPSGSLLWAQGFGGGSGDIATAVAVDSSNNIVLLGSLQSANVNFGSGFTLSPLGSSSIVLIKFSASGTALWAKVHGTGTVMPLSMALDSSDNIAVAGQVQNGSSDFGGGTISSANPGLLSTFVAKYSSSGAYQWAKAFGGSSVDGGFGIAADPHTGNIVVTGGFQGTANFGGGAVSSTGEGVFLAGYDPSGNFLWAQNFGGASGNSSGNAVKIDANGNLALTGVKSGLWIVGGTMNFDNGFFLETYALSGNTSPVLRWSHLPSADVTSAGNGIAFDSFGHVLATGSFSYGTLDFGGILAVTLANSEDGFVAEYTK